MARTPMVLLSLRIAAEEADAAEDLAREARITLTAWIRQAIRDKLKESQS